MKISKVKPHFDREAIARDHSFWVLKTDKDYIRYGAKILDSPIFEGKVEAVAYTGGNSVWVMLPAAANGGKLLSQAVKDFGDDSYSWDSKHVGEIEDRILLKLLLCSLARSSYERNQCCNVGGKLLMSSVSHMKREKKRVAQIHAIEVRVSDDMCLTLSVRTFTSLSKKDSIRKGKTPPEERSRYELVNGVFLRRALGGGGEESKFVQGTTVNDGRYRIPFLGLNDEKSFRSSKMGFLCDVLERLEERYGEVVSLEFQEVEEVYRIDCKPVDKGKWRDGVARKLESAPLFVVDATGEASHIVEETVNNLHELFDIEAKVSDCVVPNAANIRIVHQASYYEGEELNDPHNEEFGSAVVQRITIEEVESKRAKKKERSSYEGIFENSLKELCIKLDVFRGRLSMVDWPSLDLGGPWTFGLRIPAKEEGEIPRYAFMEIGTDGSTSYSLEERDWFSRSTHERLIDALDSKDVELVIEGPDGDINAIDVTEMYSLPEVSELGEAFFEKGKVSRGAEGRAQFLSGVTDIAFVQTPDGASYYRVGIIGAGMNRSIACASILRRIRPIGDSKLLFPQALCLVNVDFVRMRQLSITPFPLKYLREWVRMNYRAYAELL